MATHPRILAWRIPWAEEPGGLQSMGSQRVGHDSVTSSLTSFTFMNQILRNPKVQASGHLVLFPGLSGCPSADPRTSQTHPFSGVAHWGSVHRFASGEMPPAPPGDAFGHLPREIILHL